MTPGRLALLVVFLLLGLAVPITLLIKEKAKPGAPGTTLPEPVSYAKPATGGKFTLVVFGSPETEAALKPGPILSHSEEVRRKYPQPGMYTADAALVYPLAGYVPDENAFLTSDGRCVVRLEGDWWKTRPYPSGSRLPPDKEAGQLDAPAVSLFLDGKLLKQYPLRELLTDPGSVPHSPEHILWPGGAVLNDAEGRFHLYTQDAHRITFDVRTGEIVTREPVGFGSRFSQRMVFGTLALTVLLAVGYAVWALKRRRPIAPVPLDPADANG